MTKEPTQPLWVHYRLTIHADDLAGGLPVDPRLIDAWQQAHWSKRPDVVLQPGDPKTPEEAAARTADLLSGVVADEAGWTTFPRDPVTKELCIEGRQIKAALKEAANICKGMEPFFVRGKQVPLRSKLAERVFVLERLLPMSPSRTEPDDTIERPIHVMTAQGPRDALKRTDIVRNVVLGCTLRVLNDGLFTKGLLEGLLEYAGQNGLGADRSQGMGRFTAGLE